MNDLELYREELANCDAKITEALKERYAIIEKIMAYKEEYGKCSRDEKNGRVVLLTASPETIYERVKDSNDRPVLNGRKNVKRHFRTYGEAS